VGYNLNKRRHRLIWFQAVALTANGERQGYYGCSFKSYQDTLYAKAGYQYYSNCYIEGKYVDSLENYEANEM
jgi:pectinesterase